MTEQVSNLFEYLLALRHLSYEPIKDVRKHEHYFYLDQLLIHPGCRLVKNEQHQMTYFEVARPEFKEDYPSVSLFLQKLYELIDFQYQNESVEVKTLDVIENQMMIKLQELKQRLTEPTVCIKLTVWDQFLLMTDEQQLPVAVVSERLVKFESFNWQAAHEQYIAQWVTWKEKRVKKRQTQKFYNYLFQLMQEIKDGGAPLELMLGSGILQYETTSAIYYPILTMKLEITFDADRGVAMILPSTQGGTLELETLSSIKLANNQEILNLRQQIRAELLNLFDVKKHETWLKQFIHLMHPSAVFTTDESAHYASNVPVMLQRQVLYVRQTSDALLKEDLRQTIQYVEEGNKIPKTIQAILQSDTSTVEPHESREWEQLAKSLLLPLHANEEQRDIVKRLSTNIAVTVQGPPGTGKSHTIANLISHLLANGKRVLVTSEKDKALRVLMEKIPSEILPLCMTYLGGDRQALEHLERSVRHISQGLTEHDQKSLEKEIHSLNHQLEMIRRQMSLTKRNIIKFMELDSKTISYHEQMYQPYELTGLLNTTYQQYRWFTDKIDMSDDVPLSDEEFVWLWELKCELSNEYETLLQYEWPDMNQLPRVEQYESLLHQKAVLQRELQAMQVAPLKLKQQIPTHVLASLKEKVEEAHHQLKQLERHEYRDIFKQCLSSETQYQRFTAAYEKFDAILYDLNECDKSLLQDEIVCEFLDHPQMLTFLKQAHEKVCDKKLLTSMYLSFNREFKQFYETTRINDKKLANVEDIKKLKRHMERHQLLKTFKRTWQHELPSMVLADHVHTAMLYQMMKQFRFALYGATMLYDLNEELRQYEIMTHDLTERDVWRLEILQQQLSATYYEREVNQSEQSYTQLISSYETLLLSKAFHPSVKSLYEALQSRDLFAYKQAYQTLKHLNEIKTKGEQFNAYLSRLKVKAPQFAQFIETRVGKKQPIPGTFQDIFMYGKLNTYILLLNDCDVTALEQKLTDLELEEKKVILTLIEKMTWYQLIKNITPQQDRALQIWMQQMKQLGKGSGKQAEMLKKMSRSQMEKCQHAIPVWIMPTKEALETFKVNPDLFDVVIIDESSQSNILSLPLFMRAKRAVIVGDEQQISPVVPGIKESLVQELYSRYLNRDLELESFDLETSIYDIALQVFSSKGKLMLKEHFRSVPEIISFSNEKFYHHEMMPLKLPTNPKNQKQPIIAVYIEQAMRDERKVNVQEAERIIMHIQEMVADRAYDNQTMGVISLLGSEQARYIQRRLIETIGEKEMINRHLICGDAYSFQGDERDIMFLSLVVAPNMRYNALNQKMYRQRFNVSATRAKVQMRLYHSVKLEELSKDDLRYDLVQYFYHPTPSLDFKEKACKTQFERDVKTYFESLGYLVYPSVKIGKYEVDLVIQSEFKRIGLSCDGDLVLTPAMIEQELTRQRTLKRSGWEFARLRATAFYQNKEQAIEFIVQQLEAR